jgi:hypothetical protein
VSTFSELVKEWSSEEGRQPLCAELEARKVPLSHRLGPDGQPDHYTVLDREVPVIEIAETADFDQLRRQWAGQAPEGERERRAAAVDDLVDALHDLDLAQVSADSSRPVQLSVQIPVGSSFPVTVPGAPESAAPVTSLMSAPVPADGPATLPAALPAPAGRNVLRTTRQARRRRLADLYDRRMS